jgi:hypothetical protein
MAGHMTLSPFARMTEEHVWLAMKFMLHLFSLLNAPRTSLVLQLAAM